MSLKMGKMCQSGAVVAAVVAVLEKQNNNINQCFSSSTKTSDTKKNSSPYYDSDESNVSCSSSVTKNNLCLVDEFSFESAVNDFNSVAEDVQKICTSNSLKRDQHNIITDLQDKNVVFHDVEFEQNPQNRELNNRGQETPPLSGAVYSESANADKKSSDSDGERDPIISDNLATISEEISSSQSCQGNHCVMFNILT